MPTIYLSNEPDKKLTQQEGELLNNGLSAGTVIIEPVFTDNLNGTFDIGECQVLLYDNSSHEGELKRYTIASQAGLVAPVNMTSYLVVNYNSGSPVYQVTSDVEIINESDIIPITTIFNESDTLLHTIDWNLIGQGLSNKIHKRLVKTQRFAHESGIVLSETNTPANRTVLLSSGRIWVGSHEVDLPSFDSSTDRWLFWYHSAGSWTFSLGTTQYNNTQYDDGTDLQNLGPNTYAVNWVYRDLDQMSHAGYVLGSQQYNSLASAVAAQPRNDLPPEIVSHGILVGKIIVLNGATTATQIDSAFDIEFTGSVVTNHNNLSGLQGGTASEYYHLNNVDYQALTQQSGRVDLDILKVRNDFEMSFDGTIHLNDELNNDYLMWEDYTTDLSRANSQGVNAPAWTQLRDGIYGWGFAPATMNEMWITVHIKHDIALGTLLYPHVHWSPNTTGTGVIRWGFEYTVARGHQQEAYPATTTVYVDQTVTGTQYLHYIAETSMTDAIPSTNIEPDSVVICRLFRDAAHANDTFPDIAIAYMFDLHIQKNRFGTVQKVPPFYTL